MAKINTLVLFSLLFGLVYSYGGTPQLSRKLNVRPTLREQPIVQQQPILTQIIDTTPVETETPTFTFPQEPVVQQTTFTETQTLPTTSYGSQQTISRDSLRKQTTGLKKVLQKETVTTQTSGGYGLTPTLITVTVPPPVPVVVPVVQQQTVRKTMMQTPSGYSSSSSTHQRTQSTISKPTIKINKPLQREQVQVQVVVDPCTPNPCKNSGLCTKVTDTTFTCTCTPYFFGDYCEFQKVQQVLSPVPSSQLLTPSTSYGKPTFSTSMDIAKETSTLTSCSQNPCLNEATCVEQAGGFFCQCPWGWSGRYCEICITDCASNPCGPNKKCRAFFNGGYECICPPDRTGTNCEIQNDVCSVNPCLNGGTCRASTTSTELYQCICVMPFAGVNCESEWTNPCTAEVLRNTEVIQFENPWDRTKYIICTDVDQWMTMSCSEGTVFSSQLGHCVPENYEAPLCPPKFCLNDGECIVNEVTGELGCTCKAGFTGKNCEVNIDECQLYGNPCGMGQCVDQINTYYCYCPDGGIGLDCTYTIQNPCTPENLAADMTFFTILSADGDHYLRCADVNVWTVHRCAQGLFWDQQEKTCTIDKPADLTGQCVDGPCKNGGSCVDLGSSFKCMCKEGYAGDLCESMIDYCASNPCMNGGRCLPYAGGYTCVCPDKIIDDCCCNGLINPCPEKTKLIPGVNNYYPHIFPHKYIHCDFDGRAFVRNCAVGTRWSQEALSCLPDDFVLNTTQTIIQTPMSQTKTVEQTYTQLPVLTQTSNLNTQRVKLIKEMPKVQKTITTTIVQQKPVDTQSSYTQLPVLTQTMPKPVETQSSYTQLPVLTQTIQKTVQLPKPKPLPIQKQTITVVQTPVQTVPVQTQTTYNTLPVLTQTVPKPVLPIQQPTIQRTSVRVEQTPSTYNTLPTIEKPIGRTMMETPTGYGSSSTQTTDDSTSMDDQTFVDGTDYNQDDFTQDQLTSDLTDTSSFGTQQQTQQQQFGRLSVPSVPLTQTMTQPMTPMQQQQPIVMQQMIPMQQQQPIVMQQQQPTIQTLPIQQQPQLTQSRTIQVQRPMVQQTPQRTQQQTMTGGLQGIGRTLTQQQQPVQYRS